jgi:putative peptide zinc metalloprotease protein
MVTLQDSLLSSSARKSPIRMRPDLVAQKQHYLGRTYWVVKDPIGLQYYRFQEEEFAILRMFDGATSLDEVKERFEAEYPPEKITLEDLQQFLGMLHRSGLVIADVPGQGHQLRKRRDERKWKMFLAGISNILCIRFKGFDPERFLTWLYPKIRWFFSPVMFFCCCVLALSAATLVTVEFDEFRAKLPEFHQFFSIHNAFWLMVVLGMTKVLHEFGHGLSCKHFGGECHEMGIMVLVLTPCLYCNVSDSWMLPSKWARAAIGAAGIYVEVVIASICTFLWWFSVPETLFHNLCLDVMFISSVTTIVFNANPLLRYDGYYILSDMMEIPNLRQKATTILSRKLGEWCLGLEPPDDPFLPQRNQLFFALYSVAAAAYRWVVALSICWFLYRLFLSYHLEIVGKLMVAASLWGLFVMPMWQLGKFFYVPGRIDQVKKPRFYISLSVLTAALLAFLFLPLPHSFICPFELQPRDADSVYVEVPGRLVVLDVKAGQQVAKGQQLAQLENVDVDLQIAKLQGSLDENQTKRDNLIRQAFLDPHAADQIPQITEQIAALKDELKQQRSDKRRLRLTAPVAGTVFAPLWTPRRDDPNEKLHTWYGTPLEKENLGARLVERTLFCQVGDPHKLEAVMVIDETDRSLVHNDEDQAVDIKLEGYAGLTIESKIVEVAESELKIVPKRLTTKSQGEVPTKTDPQTYVERPMSTSYQARAPIDDPKGEYRIGLRGQAKVHTRWLSLGARLWRLLTHTFHFKLG